MEVDFTSSFRREYQALRNILLKERVGKAIGIVEKAMTSRDIPNLKKLKGHPTAYRIRVGDYRLGLYLDNGKAIFTTVDHRANIYSHFP